MFSISAMAAADSLGTSRTSTGTLSRPASLAARKRRSPAMISYKGWSSHASPWGKVASAAAMATRLLRASWVPRGRTKIGCMMPCTLMDSANSYSAPSSMRVLGWYMPATKSVSGKVVGLEASAERSWVAVGPKRASKPMPNPLGFLVTI